jgi:hypothetical protein
LELAHDARAGKDRPTPPAGVVIEARDLSVYDTIFGTAAVTEAVAGEEVA